MPEQEVINWKAHAVAVFTLLISGYLVVRWLCLHGHITDEQQQTANISLNVTAILYAVYLAKVTADTQRVVYDNPTYKFACELSDEMGNDWKDPKTRSIYVKSTARIMKGMKGQLERIARSPDGSVEELMRDEPVGHKCPAMAEYEKNQRLKAIRGERKARGLTPTQWKPYIFSHTPSIRLHEGDTTIISDVKYKYENGQLKQVDP